MGVFPNITEEDLIIKGKLAEKQKNQRAPNSKNRILKQTHDKNKQKVFHLSLKK